MPDLEETTARLVNLYQELCTFSGDTDQLENIINSLEQEFLAVQKSPEKISTEQLNILVQFCEKGIHHIASQIVLLNRELCATNKQKFAINTYNNNLIY